MDARCFGRLFLPRSPVPLPDESVFDAEAVWQGCAGREGD